MKNKIVLEATILRFSFKKVFLKGVQNSSKLTVKELFLLKLQTVGLKPIATKTKKIPLKMPLKLPLKMKKAKYH